MVSADLLYRDNIHRFPLLSEEKVLSVYGKASNNEMLHVEFEYLEKKKRLN